MQAHGRHFSVGDIVLFGSRAGVVLACVQEGDAFFAIVEELALIEQITPQSATWRIGGARSLWHAASLFEVPRTLSNIVSLRPSDPNNENQLYTTDHCKRGDSFNLDR